MLRREPLQHLLHDLTGRNDVQFIDVHKPVSA